MSIYKCMACDNYADTNDHGYNIIDGVQICDYCAVRMEDDTDLVPISNELVGESI